MSNNSGARTSGQVLRRTVVGLLGFALLTALILPVTVISAPDRGSYSKKYEDWKKKQQGSSTNSSTNTNTAKSSSKASVSQNTQGASQNTSATGNKTTINVYSLRARERPTVSTPVTWDEVEHAARRRKAATLVFEAEDVLRRVEERGDLFAPVLELKQKLPPLSALDA